MQKITGTRQEVESQLANMAKPGCKKCYGRGYTGFNRTKREYVLCKCCDKKK